MSKTCLRCSKKIKWYHERIATKAEDYHRECALQYLLESDDVDIVGQFINHKGFRSKSRLKISQHYKNIFDKSISYNLRCRCGCLIPVMLALEVDITKFHCKKCNTLFKIHCEEKNFNTINNNDELVIGRLWKNVESKTALGTFIKCPVCSYITSYLKSRPKIRCRSCWSKIDVKDDERQIEVHKYGSTEEVKLYPMEY